MHRSKLITLIRTFTKEEMKEFEKFISSPYFSSGRNLKLLFSVIKKYHPDFNSPHFTKEKIFKKLYPGKEFERRKAAHALQVLLSELQTKAETFIMVNHFIGKNAFKEACLLSELRHRGLNDSFASAYEKILSSIENFDSLFAEIDSYRHYLLKTKEITEEYKQKDREFLRLLSTLARNKENKKHDSLVNLKKEVENIGFITYHTTWIIEKINKLI